MPDNNLLLALHTYAAQQDENFTTEAFVHLVRHLQIHEPKAACALFDFLTGGKLRFDLCDCSKLQIKTQWVYSGGIPDILITGPNHFVIIEVKVEAELGDMQLEKYKERLNSQNETYKCLTLLSRYPVDLGENENNIVRVRWHGVGRLLEQNLSKETEPISAMLIRQFLEFLKERGMAMEKVSWELVRGVQALMNLMGLVEDAMVSCSDIAKRQKLSGTTHNGFSFLINGTACWSGVYLSKPQFLVFEAYNVSKAAAKSASVGRILSKADPDFGHFEKQSKDPFKWVNRIDLESEEVHFFALSIENQQKRLEEFVETSASAVKKMTP